MLRSGYQQLPSKLPGNRGFDGVFVKYGVGDKPIDILIVESKFSSTGRYSLTNTKKGRQASEKWIYGTIDEMMINELDESLADTALLIIEHVPSNLVRVKLNLLNPLGVNRWNTFDSYTLKPRGKS